MNGEMDASTKDQVWTQDDLLNLLEAMKVNLPQKDLAKYKTSESHLDWEKVAFNSFTGEMCKQKWNEVSKVIRKFRTLTELIFDAQDFIKNPYKGKKLKVSCISSFYDRHYQLILSQVTHYFLSKFSHLMKLI
ncbi:nucleolar transcription factor 1-like [Salvelinus sp. IW2-2015]|uniref:nucleolar transcription factor 1-like n=1 Tax=Salvelinus sp. IW2-2015 TaxID=2691554 RepID=UPI000CEABA28|nr:nucleolar transcription factor 1-like [Salvelinus alpinus]